MEKTKKESFSGSIIMDGLVLAVTVLLLFACMLVGYNLIGFLGIF